MLVITPGSSDNLYAFFNLLSNTQEAKKNLDELVQATAEYHAIADEANLVVDAANAAKVEVEHSTNALNSQRADVVSQTKVAAEAQAAAEAKMQEALTYSKMVEVVLADRAKELDAALAKTAKAEATAIKSIEQYNNLSQKAEQTISEYNAKLSALRNLAGA